MTQSLNDHQPGYAVLAELHRIHQDASKPLSEEAHHWYMGYLGELEVGGRLNKLRAEGYTVLHGVQPGTGKADVDHLVITPSCFVYAINTKHHKGKKITGYDNGLMINGSKAPHIKKSRDEVKKVLGYLDGKQVPLSGQQGALAFVGVSAPRCQEAIRHLDAERLGAGGPHQAR